MTPDLLNLGCGHCWHPAFTNVDFVSTAPCVRAYDLRQGIPYEDGTFDLVYHAHILEHFDLHTGRRLLQECQRVLKAGGLLRVVVPDLEQWARVYLAACDAVDSGAPRAGDQHQWMVIELVDQMVRTESGGEFLEFMRTCPAELRDYLENRVGRFQEYVASMAAKPPAVPPPSNLWDRFKDRWRPAYRLLRSQAARKEWWLRRLLGAEYDFLREARFRHRGEIHRWMYDRRSLDAILRQCGFTQTTVESAVTSQFAGWAAFELDTYPDGGARRPNSLYFEARKPPANA